MCAALINERHSDYTLMDAGCRTMDLKHLLKGCREYYGSDLVAGEGVLECNLEEPLPFDDNQFDIVTALDVLEHLNNPHGALHELVRIAKKSVYVSLPNMHYVKFRMNFLTGKGISGKYTFQNEPVLDRHRWVLSFTEARDFISHNTRGSEVVFHTIVPARGRMRHTLGPIEHKLAEMRPNAFAYGILAEIHK